MASLADKAILLGADNRPSMLEKEMYDSWKSRMELYMLNRPYGMMILESVEQGPWFSKSMLSQEGLAVKTKSTKSSTEQAFWSQYSVQTDKLNLSGTTIVEVPKEIPKVSMVNSCLKRLKFHLASFDMVVKERTTAIAITEGIVYFILSMFDEVTEVQNIFKQMELAVEQHCAEKTKFQTKMENVLQENDRLLTQALSVEIMNIVVHDNVKFDCLNRDIVSSSESAPTFAELFKINDLKDQVQVKDTVILKLKEKLNSLSGDVKIQEKDTVILKLKEKIKSSSGDVKENKVESKVEEIETQNLELDHKEKVLVITALKEQLKGKAVLTKAVSLNPIGPALLQVDVVPLVPKLRKNRTAHIDYIKHTQEEAATLRELVETERLLSPLNTSLAYA
nr:hypothetical protein [Tanacetum cinerariifolium]